MFCRNFSPSSWLRRDVLVVAGAGFHRRQSLFWSMTTAMLMATLEARFSPLRPIPALDSPEADRSYSDNYRTAQYS